MARTDVVRALCAAVSLLMADTVDARPPKHLPTQPGDDPVASLQLAKLEDVDGAIPVVALVRESAIELHWWAPRARAWRSVRVTTSSSTVPAGNPVVLDRSPVEIRGWSWSGSVGLTAVGKTVFLAYKRLGFLYLARHVWQPEAEVLAPDPAAPVLVPLRAPGFGVWAGAIEGRLVLVAQGSAADGDPRLFALVAESPASADLGSPEAWNTHALGDGGWSFDARGVASRLHVVFRKAPFAGGANLAPSPVSQSLALAGDATSYQAPLFLTSLDVVTGARDAEQQAPGCEHPQLHAVEPAVITCDRLEGSARVQGFYPENTCVACHPSGPAVRAVPRAPASCADCHRSTTVEVRPARLVKFLLRADGERWIENRLFTVSADALPRNLPGTTGRGDEGFHLLAGLGLPAQVTFGFLNAWAPLQLVGRPPPSSDKVAEIDLLYHRPEFAALALTRWRVGNQGGPGTEAGVAIVDLNHGQIPSLRELGAPENLQFGPFSRSEVPDVVSNGRLRIDPATMRTDNTIGGALVRHPDDPGLSFYGYTDLGDGGARVIFETTPVIPPTPLPSAGKGLPPGSVVGPGGSSARWVDLPEAEAFRDPRLPAFISGGRAPLVTDVDPSLDVITALVERDEDGTWAVTEQIAWQRLDAFAHIMSQALHDWSEWSSGAALQLRQRPRAPLPRQRVELEVSGGPAGASYRWSFGDGSPEEETNQPACTHEFPVSMEAPSEERTYLVEARMVGGASDQVGRLEVRVQPPAWERLWEVHGELAAASDAVAIANADLSFSKFTLGYRFAQGQRDRVVLARRDRYDVQYRFLGNPYGPGWVDGRLALTFGSREVEVQGAIGAFYSIQRIEVGLSHVRRYTPAVLTSEYRWRYGDLLEPGVAALALKPVEVGRVAVDRVEIDGSLTLLGGTLLALVAALTVLGLVALAAWISGVLSSAAAVATSSPWGWVIAALMLAGLIAAVEVVVPAAIDGQIAGQIRESIATDDVRARLDELARNGGEGLAEALAVEARRALDGAEPPADGRSRTQRDLWEMVDVGYGKARVLVRVPASP